MRRLTLQHPIRTLDNQLLFPPGTLLTEETLDAVIDSHRADSYQTYPLLLHGSVKEDCLNFLSTPPYVTIFPDKKQIDALLNLLEAVHFSIPILQSLDYFKQHDLYTYAHVLMVFALSTLLPGVYPVVRNWPYPRHWQNLRAPAHPEKDDASHQN
jgi:hypothetical protein